MAKKHRKRIQIQCLNKSHICLRKKKCMLSLSMHLLNVARLSRDT